MKPCQMYHSSEPTQTRRRINYGAVLLSTPKEPLPYDACWQMLQAIWERDTGKSFKLRSNVLNEQSREGLSKHKDTVPAKILTNKS